MIQAGLNYRFIVGPWCPFVPSTSGPILEDTEIVLDDTLVSKIYTLVDTFGKNIIFRTREDSYDYTTGHNTETIAEVTRKTTPPDGYSRRFIRRDLRQHGVVRVYLPSLGLTFDPVVGMEVLIDGTRWRIIGRKFIYSITEVGAYELILKQ